jgi:hypothetical protein
VSLLTDPVVRQTITNKEERNRHYSIHWSLPTSRVTSRSYRRYARQDIHRRVLPTSSLPISRTRLQADRIDRAAGGILTGSIDDNCIDGCLSQSIQSILNTVATRRVSFLIQRLSLASCLCYDSRGNQLAISSGKRGRVFSMSSVCRGYQRACNTRSNCNMPTSQ